MKVSQKGFTLVEAMVALSIFIVLAGFAPLLIKVLSPPVQSGVSMEELESFYSAIGQAIREAVNAEASEEKLTLTTSSGQSVTYSFYQNRIRKQINGQGYEIWLFSVKRFRPSVTGQLVTVSITDTASHVYKRVFARQAEIVLVNS
ncbi:prepilin-type N-terminal cleavage/methylation domain-containing protein [Fictibacillus sp. WQ 8-8]|uniref:competence type IV pilus minor pilin ComGF n=1 Tax=unclassified Fictibacillus TaxID=2644029 RepID=UPI0006A7E08F|nr:MULTISPECIES: competence type IV pilus minor pilin ComGF [unclassified Fictibacillus]MCQ6266196.1 prepilin-type N-terminal cleavage/methylation domain-containing protein [Fictibacillus sp. WQ 8-8]MED2972584.1 competence type IV pilus minor pilin ComGF [Fictibacillus sp. B-59209]UZJ80673.1 competence type IV pilus minor pilin ComGF [Fictibacillus sp. KU28468]SFD69397.1 prepilin-type N-terminal cleavage/methylation domain-containing protein [Bacillus sp. OV194]